MVKVCPGMRLLLNTAQETDRNPGSRSEKLVPSLPGIYGELQAVKTRSQRRDDFCSETCEDEIRQIV